MVAQAAEQLQNIQRQLDRQKEHITKYRSIIADQEAERTAVLSSLSEATAAAGLCLKKFGKCLTNWK